MLPVSDDSRTRMLIEHVNLATEKPDHMRTDFVIRIGWAVVPFDAGLLYEPQLPELISAAARAIGCTECYGLVQESLLNVDNYVVAMTVADLTDFARICGHFKYVLIPASKDFLVLCNFVDDYCLMCGPRSFVEASLGQSIGAARKAFLDWIEAFDSSEPARNLLLAVSRRYEACNGNCDKRSRE